MQLDILTPEGKVFSGDVDSIQLPGIDGLFQILNNHAPLISALKEGTATVGSKDGNKTFEIKSGIVEVHNNQISVLTEGVK
ncbi:MAG: ATP synthase F1 subunit epsilon [Chitinophagales bacterium]|nr:ATP synthase F1 subunit epsilon [Chitinophagales bacterium]